MKRKKINRKVNIIILIIFGKTSTFLKKAILSMGVLRGEKLGIDKGVTLEQGRMTGKKQKK